MGRIFLDHFFEDSGLFPMLRTDVVTGVLRTLAVQALEDDCTDSVFCVVLRTAGTRH